MTQQESQQHKNKDQESKLSCLVRDRIAQDSLTPSARWKFLCMNYFVWIAWSVSVIFGAVSFTVLIYVGDHARFALYEATHSTQLSFFAEILPLMWIVAFLIMGALAYYNMRHTRSGYKYPLWQLLTSSMVFSIVGGIVLHVFGVGYVIDTQLGKGMPLYKSYERTEAQMWQNPEEGRLLGMFSKMDEEEQQVYIFIDENGISWNIKTIELRTPDRDLLSSGKTVRVLGTTKNQKAGYFHACGVFPWMYNGTVSTKGMRADRKVFIERMYEHMEKGDRIDGFEREVFKENQDMPFNEGLCADLAVVKRMKF